ncbi:MAG: hypothetical protein IT462_09755 [Planctomycetes bacterium]|nr:hypothetical protein [Planctomycetota bacterium]
MTDEPTFTQLAAQAAGEPLGEKAPSSPETDAELARLTALVGVLRDATLPAGADRLTQLNQRVSAPPMRRWFALAAAIAIVGMVGVLAAVSMRPAPVGSPEGQLARANKPAPAKEDPAREGNTAKAKTSDWLKKTVAGGKPRKDTEGGRIRGGDFGTRGGDRIGAPPPGEPKGALGGGGGDDGLKPVAKLVPFAVFKFTDLPRGYALSGAKVQRAADTSLGFDVVQIEYKSGSHMVLLLQAAATDESRRAFAEQAKGETVIERDGTLILITAPNFDADAVKKLVDGLKPAK